MSASTPYTFIGGRIFCLLFLFSQFGNSQILGDSTKATKGSNAFFIDLKNPQKNYSTGRNHTLVFAIRNNSNLEDDLALDVVFPDDWKVLTKGAFKRVGKTPGIFLLNIFIPQNSKPGIVKIQLRLKNKEEQFLLIKRLDLKVAANPQINLSVLNTSKLTDGKNRIETIFQIENKGNVVQNLTLLSNGEIASSKKIELDPDSTAIIRISKKINSKIYRLHNVKIELNAINKKLDTVYTTSSKFTLYPNKIKRHKPLRYFPIKLGINYNSISQGNYHYSTVAGDLNGNGYLDPNKNHYINISVRFPPKNKIKRFGVTDQYSLLYRYKDSTFLFLGDHAHSIDVLGFDSRHGMGFRLEHYKPKWGYLIYYSKPRLFNYNSSPLFGSKIIFKPSDNLDLGFSIARSQGTIQGANPSINSNIDEVGQIGVLSINYNHNNTRIASESSISFTNHHTSTAGRILVSQKLRNIFYSGGLTIASKNYFGTIKNSIQYQNNLSWNINSLNLSIGQAVSRVNKRLNPLFYAAEPFSQNYYAGIGYKLNRQQTLRLRLYKRIREDKMTSRAFYYDEYGVNYIYRLKYNPFSFNFSGRIGKTKNFLSGNNSYLTSFSHNLNFNYRLNTKIALRSSLTHDYSNRYNVLNQKTNFTRFSLGTNFLVLKKLRISFNYNSGFSPEENYLKREFLSTNIVFEPVKHHHLELRGNYYQRPGQNGEGELFASARYTWSLNIPLKRKKEIGRILGEILIKQADVNLSDFKLVAGNQKVQTDKNGKFEFNNLPLDLKYIKVDESTIPAGFVVQGSHPIELDLSKKSSKYLDVHLIKCGKFNGTITLFKDEKRSGYDGFVRIKNSDNQYLTKPDKNGNFEFNKVVPGMYEFELIGFKNSDYYEKVPLNFVEIKEASTKSIVLDLKKKVRKIKFIKKNFKVLTN